MSKIIDPNKNDKINKNKIIKEKQLFSREINCVELIKYKNKD